MLLFLTGINRDPDTTREVAPVTYPLGNLSKRVNTRAESADIPSCLSSVLPAYDETPTSSSVRRGGSFRGRCVETVDNRTSLHPGRDRLED